MVAQRWPSFLLGATLLLWNPQAHAVTITGTVVDAGGKPVTDATVFVWYRDASFELAIVETKPDQQGAFSLAFEPNVKRLRTQWTVAGFSPSYALGCQKVADGGSCALKLTEEPVPFTGVVVDEEGKPIPGAQVAISMIHLSEAPLRTLWARGVSGLTQTTDAAGRFAVPGIPAGVRVFPQFSAPGRVLLHVGVGFDSARRQDLCITLLPAAQIRGRVTRDGNPVSGIQVMAQSQEREPDGWAETTTTLDGSYILDKLPGSTYDVMIEPPKGLTAVALEGITVEAGQHAEVPDIKLIEGGYVEGKVTKQDTGAPAEGAWIGAYGPARPESSAAIQSTGTDADGDYRILLPPGRNTVYSAGGIKGYRRGEPGPTHLEIKQSETVSGIDFQLIPDLNLELKVRVLNPDGTPAAGVLASTAFLAHTGVREVTTDAEGIACFKADAEASELSRAYLQQLLLVVLARDPSRDLAGAAVLRGLDDPPDIRLAEGAYAVAKVLDVEGNPVADAAVRVRLMPELHHYVECLRPRSDEQGRLRIGPLPPDYPVQVLLSNELEVIATNTAWRDLSPFSLIPGQDYKLPDFVVDPQGAPVEGRVVDADGKPVARALVVISSWDNAPHLHMATNVYLRTMTDAQGGFRFTGVPANRTAYLFACVLGKELLGGGQVGPGIGWAPEITIVPPGKARGRILQPGGKPLANVEVEVRALTLARIGWDGLQLPPAVLKRAPREQKTRTDAEGVWQVGNVIHGVAYYVIARGPRDPEGTYCWGEFTAEGGKTVDVGDLSVQEWLG